MASIGKKERKKKSKKEIIVADNMIVYIENPKESIDKLLPLINELGRLWIQGQIKIDCIPV